MILLFRPSKEITRLNTGQINSLNSHLQVNTKFKMLRSMNHNTIPNKRNS